MKEFVQKIKEICLKQIISIFIHNLRKEFLEKLRVILLVESSSMEFLNIWGGWFKGESEDEGCWKLHLISSGSWIFINVKICSTIFLSSE